MYLYRSILCNLELMHSVLNDFRVELTSNSNILVTYNVHVASLHINVTCLLPLCLHFLLSGGFMAERFVKPVLSKSPERYNHNVKK